MSDVPNEDMDPVEMARKHAVVAENMYTKHATSNPFFAASVAMSNMWSAVAQAEAAMRTFTEVLRTGPQDN